MEINLLVFQEPRGVMRIFQFVRIICHYLSLHLQQLTRIITHRCSQYVHLPQHQDSQVLLNFFASKTISICTAIRLI